MHSRARIPPGELTSQPASQLFVTSTIGFSIPLEGKHLRGSDVNLLLLYIDGDVATHDTDEPERRPPSSSSYRQPEDHSRADAAAPLSPRPAPHSLCPLPLRPPQAKQVPRQLQRQ